MVTGLSYGTNYRVAVRSMCDASNASDWTDTIMITTSNCYSVSNVTAEPSYTEAAINWAMGADMNDHWEVVWGNPGFHEGYEMGRLEVEGAPHMNITGLDSATSYVAKVRSLCEDGRYSEWSSVNFTTLSGGSQEEGIAVVDGMSVDIYPNPASTATTIAVKGVEGRVNIAIIGIDGRTVRTFTKDCPADCEMVLDVEGLAKGSYVVRLYNDQQANGDKKGFDITRKFFVN
jgi:hypothetical protein